MGGGWVEEAERLAGSGVARNANGK